MPPPTSPSAPASSTPPRCYIILLNWNQWEYTVRCLESVFRQDYPDYRVIVCDNGSTDDSLDRIAAWAAGALTLPADPVAALRDLSSPPVPKPIAHIVLDRALAESGDLGAGAEPPLVLIRTGGNIGFAAGNNVGLRYALARGFDFVWLLNTDTVVAPGALRALVAAATADPRIGMAGSTIRDYERPDRIQALGGCGFNVWLARPTHLGAGRPAAAPIDPAAVVRRLRYVLGASMLVSRRFLEDVGLMEESFFLHFEEIDWAERARGRFTLGYAPDSTVWHRMGGSSGLSGADPFFGNFVERLMFGNRIAFTRKHRSWALPTVYFGLALAFGKAILQRRWGRVRMFSRPSFWRRS